MRVCMHVCVGVFHISSFIGKFRTMENSSVMIFVVAFVVILFSHKFQSVDSVLCFNCVSTESPGCGQRLDIGSLVKARKNRREAPSLTLTTDNDNRHHRLIYPNPSRRKQEDHVSVSVSHSRTLTDTVTKLTGIPKLSEETSFKDNNIKIEAENVSVSNYLTEKKLYYEDTSFSATFTEGINFTKSQSTSTTSPTPANSTQMDVPYGRHFDDGDSDRRDTTTRAEATEAAADVNEEIEVKEGGRGSKGDDSRRRRMMVECPGNTCLSQRVPTTEGDVYVRTCDVSSQVPVGQCHLVTNVLGASVSVVCVCQGDFCNENVDSGTSVTWSTTCLVILSASVSLFGLWSRWLV